MDQIQQKICKDYFSNEEKVKKDSSKRLENAITEMQFAFLEWYGAYHMESTINEVVEKYMQFVTESKALLRKFED